MRIKLLVATSDSDYGEHLSGVVSARHADVFDVIVCSTAERLSELLSVSRYDAALIGAEMIDGLDLRNIHLPVLIWEDEGNIPVSAADLGKVGKYQRISIIVADILERFAKISASSRNTDIKKARVTAVWSPAGGVGKTTVALAYAAKMASEGKQALYLDLEYFSSVPAHFSQAGKSISTIFEMLEAQEGNIDLLIRGIRCQDNGIAYFCGPENFDDMNILTADNVALLIEACCASADELIIDLSCVCGECERQVFEYADKVLLVTDPSGIAQIKLIQFASQNNDFARIKAKAALVENKGATVDKPIVDTVISLPFVQLTDAAAICKTLSGYSFPESRS